MSPKNVQVDFDIKIYPKKLRRRPNCSEVTFFVMSSFKPIYAEILRTIQNLHEVNRHIFFFFLFNCSDKISSCILKVTLGIVAIYMENKVDNSSDNEPLLFYVQIAMLQKKKKKKEHNVPTNEQIISIVFCWLILLQWTCVLLCYLCTYCII